MNFLCGIHAGTVFSRAGSNTTGEICEAEGRNWIAFELDKDYLQTSRYHYEPRPADTTGTSTTNGKSHSAHSKRGRPKNSASYANGQAELFP